MSDPENPTPPPPDEYSEAEPEASAAPEAPPPPEAPAAPEEPEAPPPPPTEEPAPPPPSGGASSNRGLMIALSYLWLLALVPFLVEKEDKEVQWHARHGLVLLVAEVILWVVFALMSMVLGPLACALAIVQFLLFLAILVVHILCIVKGVNGERFLVPGVSQFADRF